MTYENLVRKKTPFGTQTYIN